MRKIFEAVAEEIVRIDRAEQRAVSFETQHAVRTLGAPYYTESEKAANHARFNRKQRLSSIMRRAAAQERARIELRDGKKPWPPMLRWPFNVVV